MKTPVDVLQGRRANLKRPDGILAPVESVGVSAAFDDGHTGDQADKVCEHAGLRGAASSGSDGCPSRADRQFFVRGMQERHGSSFSHRPS